MRHADLDGPKQMASVRLLQPVESVVGTGPDGAVTSFAQGRERPGSPFLIVDGDNRKHCMIGIALMGKVADRRPARIETHETVVGRHPVAAVARLEQITHRRMRKALISAEIGKRVAVEPRESSAGAEPKKATL